MSPEFESSVTLADIRAAFEHQVEAFGAMLPGEKEGFAREAEDESRASGVAPGPEQNVSHLHASMGADAYDQIFNLIPEGSPVRTMNDLASLEAWVRDTVLIPLDETRLNPVFGVGSPEADLMVIGEAPGADEDQQGEPFVGRAGQLLTKILASIGFDRSDVYIANILKSRPPDNRNPKPEEVEAHIPILYRQISLIRPLMLLCVGKTSGTSLLGVNTSLAGMRGRFQDFHGIPVMVTYHPAALLRNPNWKRPTWEDMQMVRDRYAELNGKPGSVNADREADS